MESYAYNDKSVMERLVAEAPYLSRCSDDKTARCVRPVKYAVNFPYMQVNRSGMVSWLVFDLDHDNPYVWDDVGLPAPNCIVSNPKNGHAHLFYAIPPVCTTEKARYAPIKFMKRVYEAMASALKADASYSGPVAKTPGHKWWRTTFLHNDEYNLGDLAESVELPDFNPFSKGPDLEANSHSRHCLLFEETRFYAYSIVNREREQGTYDTFLKFVSAFARNKNNYAGRGFAENLSDSQVNATVKSIARWTWERYRGSCGGVHRGAMGLSGNNEMTIQEKQKLSAKRTHKERHKKTIGKLTAGIRVLEARGEKVTFSKLAKASGLTRQTVSKYSNVIDEVRNTSVKIISLEEVRANVQRVNYGEHQITAPQAAGKKREGKVNTRLVHQWLWNCVRVEQFSTLLEFHDLLRLPINYQSLWSIGVRYCWYSFLTDPF